MTQPARGDIWCNPEGLPFVVGRIVDGDRVHPWAPYDVNTPSLPLDEFISRNHPVGINSRWLAPAAWGSLLFLREVDNQTGTVVCVDRHGIDKTLPVEIFTSGEFRNVPSLLDTTWVTTSHTILKVVFDDLAGDSVLAQNTRGKHRRVYIGTILNRYKAYAGPMLETFATADELFAAVRQCLPRRKRVEQSVSLGLGVWHALGDRTFQPGCSMNGLLHGQEVRVVVGDVLSRLFLGDVRILRGPKELLAWLDSLPADAEDIFVGDPTINHPRAEYQMGLGDVARAYLPDGGRIEVLYDPKEAAGGPAPRRSLWDRLEEL